jgi:putative transposase
MGLLLAVVVHTAGIRIGRALGLCCCVYSPASVPSRSVFADGVYSGKLIDWTRTMFGWLLTVVKRTDARRFVVLPKRWIVERTFA